MSTQLNPTINRNESLDWLRGLTALSIMIYHTYVFNFHALDSGSFVGRMGIYGVSIFFVLSGLSMALVYHSYFKTIKDVGYFYFRRIMRIFPLFWLAFFVVMLLNHRMESMSVWFDNLFFLFGFDENKTTIIPGGWSVGVEMYFYVFTPFIIIAYSYNKWLGRLIMAYLLFFGLRYAFLVLRDVTVLGANWYNYVAPFNNFFLFGFGIFLYYEFRNVKLSNVWCFSAIILATLIFMLYPVEGNQVYIVKGFNRFVFSFASILLVLGFFLLSYQPPKWIVYPLQQFGIATYGVYLLHQLLMQFLHDYCHLTNPYGLMISTILGSVLVALFIYRFFEMPFIRLGKRKIFG